MKFLPTTSRSFVIIALLSFGLYIAAEARPVLQSIKRDHAAKTGACLAPITDVEEAKEIIRRNGVRIEASANKKQILSVAIGVQQVELLAGSPSEYIEGSYFKFPKRLRYSRQTGSAIEMGANYTDGNVAHVMHELGHYVGNRGLYGPYKENVPVCEITVYSKVHYTPARYRNEEFAEVWAAFVTNPELLKNSQDAGCREAYAFFSQVFPEAEKYAVCDRAFLSSLVDSQ